MASWPCGPLKALGLVAEDVDDGHSEGVGEVARDVGGRREDMAAVCCRVNGDFVGSVVLRERRGLECVLGCVEQYGFEKGRAPSVG